MVWFIVTVVIVYLFYYIFVVNRYDKQGKLRPKRQFRLPRFGKKKKQLDKKEIKFRDEAKLPAEMELFIVKYKVDVDKINMRGFAKLMGLVCSIDISIIVTVLALLPTLNIYMLLGLGALLVIPVILISFSILGYYFKKKGLVKNENSKRNRK